MLLECPVVFQNLNQQLVGMIHEPEGGGKKPGIVFCHGFAGNRLGPHQLFIKTALKLAKEGFYVFRFDFRGSGDSHGEFIELGRRFNFQDGSMA